MCFIYYYDGYVFIIRPNKGLCISAKASFFCNLCILKLCIWNSSSVFSDWPFFSMCGISNARSMVPYVCPVSSILSSVCSFLWPGYILHTGL
jgi:hypothetical protein